ncbi:hypothetical protein M9H77_35952 [Catharanthus roseus]|uniref:Uncharacterized protein n=1 Tax=Catharanthus roseus TaxID=4058 RepID=A0ACB9ZSM7_CATRO|nr:hypothetical protein M9H77_35952 [Catharanthus roseus]
MSSSPLKSLFIIILFSSFFLLPFLQVVADSVPIKDPLSSKKYTIFLLINDDLRFHDLLVHQEFNWSFNMNFQGTTLFFCHFWWANKDKSFEVFNRDIGTNYCSTNCYWFVKEDGFYFIDDINKVFPIPKLQNW